MPACQKIVKKAVVERLKAAYGVEWFAETGPKYSLEVALLDNQATLTIDTSGPGLHKRGYRPLDRQRAAEGDDGGGDDHARASGGRTVR